MDAHGSTFVREVSRIDCPEFRPGTTAGHKSRLLIDAAYSTFADPFLVMAEDWTPRGAFPVHPHRGMETVTFVIEGSLAHRDSAGNGGVIAWLTRSEGPACRNSSSPLETRLSAFLCFRAGR
jgi:hypothetical protein